MNTRVLVMAVVLAALVLAAVLLSRQGPGPQAPIGAEHRKVARQEPVSASEPTTPPASMETNASGTLPAGFYIGKDERRVYINYASPDPVLRSLLQSVMDGSAEPNVKGREIFLKVCAACHQRDGEGKEGVAPPLVGSEWVLAPGGARLIRIVLNGLAGPIRVNGRDWNLPMPPWRANLDDDQVAVVLTYIRAQLGSQHAVPITPELVAAARKEARPTPENSADLLRISDQ